jgi:hypothetical protein
MVSVSITPSVSLHGRVGVGVIEGSAVGVGRGMVPVGSAGVKDGAALLVGEEKGVETAARNPEQPAERKRGRIRGRTAARMTRVEILTAAILLAPSPIGAFPNGEPVLA